MKRTGSFTKEERETIAGFLVAGGTPVCPRCGAPLDTWPVPPREDVSYVRDRVWLVCSPCASSVVLDR